MPAGGVFSPGFPFVFMRFVKSESFGSIAWVKIGPDIAEVRPNAATVADNGGNGEVELMGSDKEIW